MDTIICDWGLSMAGVKDAEHVYFHAVSAVDDATRAGYLDHAHRLGGTSPARRPRRTHPRA